MSAPTTITVAIIALNEEARLAKLLPCLGWADEILVVDGGSRDATVEVARSRGARVVQCPFDDFARQRNFAIEQSTGDWVLSLDADECPTSALAREIGRAIAQTRHDAFRIRIHSRIFGRPMRFSGTQDDAPVRLFRRGHARWTGHVHEVLRTKGRVGRLRNQMRHDTLADLSTFLAKMESYSTLTARQRIAAAHSPRATETWSAPLVEIARRLVWKHGWLDGPEGWAFCLLSGLSAWRTARKHHCLTRGA